MRLCTSAVLLNFRCCVGLISAVSVLFFFVGEIHPGGAGEPGAGQEVFCAGTQAEQQKHEGLVWPVYGESRLAPKLKKTNTSSSPPGTLWFRRRGAHVSRLRNYRSVLTQTSSLRLTLKKPSPLKRITADLLLGIFMFMTKINKLPAMKQWMRDVRRSVQRGPAARLSMYLC